MKQYANLRKAIYALVIGVCVACVALVIVAILKYKSKENIAPTQPTTQASEPTDPGTEMITTEAPNPESTESEAQDPSQEPTEEVQEQEFLAAEDLYNCFWDASVQTDQFFEFYPDGTGRVLNLVGRLGAKGVESEFTYEYSDGILAMAWENGRTRQWDYSPEEACFTTDAEEYDGSIYHQKIKRMSLYDLYKRWAQQLAAEEAYCAEYEWQSQIALSQGAVEAYNAWDLLLNDVYDHLMVLLTEEESSQLVSEQLQWIAQKESEMEAAYNAYAPGTAAPMFRASVGRDYTQRRTYELMLLLPEGFDHEAHDQKIASIRERFYAAEETREQMNTTFFGASATAYYLDGALQIVEEASDVSQSDNPTNYSTDFFYNCKRTWYYDDGEVYFIYMVSEENGNEYRLYFDNGELIRWVSPAGEIHDLLYCCDEMQGYYDHALSQCEFVKDREIR